MLESAVTLRNPHVLTFPGEQAALCPWNRKTESLLLSASQLGIALLFICINLGGEGVFRVCPRPSDTEMETKTPHCARPLLGRELGGCWVQPPRKNTEPFRLEKISEISEIIEFD